jgi:ubiquitin fusion degradation protein 1
MFDDPVMLFELTNVKQKKRTHCGVLEFTAEEGVCYIPYWMMQNLLLTEGDVVKLQYTKLEKGNFVKLRPQTKDFLDISDPKAVLEMTLRRYTCLTLDDTIMINYNNRRYFVDIVELKPDNAVCILDCDLNTDFAPPLDYVEPEPVFRNPPPPSVNGGNSARQGEGWAEAKRGARARGRGSEVSSLRRRRQPPRRQELPARISSRWRLMCRPPH